MAYTLTPDQIQRLSNIFDNAGQVALGGLVFGPLLAGSGLDTGRLFMIPFGIGTVLLCWAMSIWLARKSKEIYEL